MDAYSQSHLSHFDDITMGRAPLLDDIHMAQWLYIKQEALRDT